MKSIPELERDVPFAEAPDGAQALLATISSFWPGAEVSFGGDSRGADAAFHFMPNASRPRLLIPGDRRGAALAMQRFSAALSPKEMLGRCAAAALLRTAGPAAVARETIVVRGGQDSLQQHIAGLLGEPVTMAVTIGNARVNRKPVLQIFDAQGRTLAFAKVGDSVVAASDVRGEAARLAEIEGRLERFEIPRVLSLTQWQGMVVMLITAVRTVPQDPRRFWRIPLAAMDDFSLQLGHSTAPLAEVPSWQRLRAAQDDFAGTRLPELMEQVEQAAAAAPELVVGSWHGDWTGWNMAVRDDVVQLWDFERFESGVVQGMDAFHYAVNAATLREGITLSAFQGGFDHALVSLGDGLRQRLVAAAYLVTAASRYITAAAGDQGHLIAGRADTIVEALSWWLPRIHSARR